MGRTALVVTDEERTALERLARSPRRAEADRARAILLEAISQKGGNSIAVRAIAWVALRQSFQVFWRISEPRYPRSSRRVFP